MKMSLRSSLTVIAVLITAKVNSQTWNLLGNSGTTPPTHFLGTTDVQPLVFKTAPTISAPVERFRITSTGSIGINNPSPLHFVDIKVPNITGSESVMNFAVSDALNDYLKVYNGTGGGNTFYPVLAGFKGSSAVACPAIAIVGTVTSSIDSPMDANAVVMFSARKDAVGTVGSVSNRPLFSWSNFTTTHMVMAANGNLGLGAPLLFGGFPSYKLSVQTNVLNDGIQVIQTGNTSASVRLESNGTNGHVWSMFSTGTGNTEGAGNFMIYDHGVGGSGGAGTRFFISGSGNGNVGIGTHLPTAKLTVNGNVLIGDISTNLPAGYMLYVQSGILTEKVKVAIRNSASWADYVFDKDYKMLSLNELENYVKSNKHLPNIPSADEMVKEGLDVATMNAKLLEKIEELSLYIIEQNKRLESLENKLK